MITRFDPTRAARGEMLPIEHVLEILSVPLLGIIPDSEAVLRASNLGTPVTICGGDSPAARGGMNLFRSLQLAASAPVARERLQILLEYERKLDDRFHETNHM